MDIMPGSGSKVVNGASETSACALVNAPSSDDLPVLGSPAITTWPAPSLEMLKGETRLEPPWRERGARRSSANLRRRSALSLSVPLCLGTVEIR